jgi:hypothetical protein
MTYKSYMSLISLNTEILLSLNKGAIFVNTLNISAMRPFSKKVNVYINAIANSSKQSQAMYDRCCLC